MKRKLPGLTSLPVLVDEDPGYAQPMHVGGAAYTPPAHYTQTDALLSELLRVLHLLRGDVAEMNETLRRIREESTQAPQEQVVPFPSRALRHGSPT